MDARSAPRASSAVEPCLDLFLLCLLHYCATRFEHFRHGFFNDRVLPKHCFLYVVQPDNVKLRHCCRPFRFRKINQRQLCKFSVPVRVRPKDAIPFPARNGIFHDLLFLILEGMHVEF